MRQDCQTIQLLSLADKHVVSVFGSFAQCCAARVIFFHEVFWFMSVSPWIVDGHIR